MTVIAVVGSRDFDDAILLHQVLDNVISYRFQNVQLISGGAVGADALVEEYAEFNGIPFQEYSENIVHRPLSEIDKILAITDDCDECIAFWNGSSAGTAKLIEVCRARHIPIRVIPVEPKTRRYNPITGRDRASVCSL
jgi:Protein of unknown function (DUF2493).